MIDDPRLPDRFWSKMSPEPTTGCWLWVGATSHNGYGLIKVAGAVVRAHRVSYEALVGPVPDGMELDHVRTRGCATPSCVNPDHLEPVTHRENMLRGDGIAGSFARRTHCERGHAFDVENTRHHPDRAARVCRECTRQRNARRSLRYRRGRSGVAVR